MRVYVNNFSVNGKKYQFTVDPDGTVEFRALAAYKKQFGGKRTTLFDDQDSMSVEDLGSQKNSLDIFKKVKNILLNWIWETNPHTFKFSGATERKQRIFKWAANRLSKILKNQYMMYEHNDEFIFVRLENNNIIC